MSECIHVYGSKQAENTPVIHKLKECFRKLQCTFEIDKSSNFGLTSMCESMFV